MKRTTIVWFKTDLRLNDNETLTRAVEQSDEIIPVYCLDETHFAITPFGFKKTGSWRAQFLLESLQNLDANLRAMRSGLLVVSGKPEIELFLLAKKYNAHQVVAKKEVAYEEIQTELRVKKELGTIHCTLETFCTSTLYHPTDLPFEVKDIPDVFTSFRRAVENKSSVRTIFTKPEAIPSPAIPPLHLPTLEELRLSSTKIDPRAALVFKGGETEGRERMQRYFYATHSVANYKQTRNGLIGENYSSKFSAWLALGCLSPRIIFSELKNNYELLHPANESTYWLVFELLWRDYFYFMMAKHGHNYFMQTGIKNKVDKLQNHQPGVFQRWANGNTGNDFIDANMLELKLTGYMSNRGRQNVASYLCHDLKSDWRYGAAYFEEQLIDYDVRSNWCNWAYLAGVGNDPRGDRHFNIEKQAKDYDPNNLYRDLWLKPRNEMRNTD